MAEAKDSDAVGTRGQYHRGAYVGTKATPLPAEDGRPSFVWYGIVISLDDGDVSVGSGNKEAVKAAVGGVEVGELLELQTYSKVSKTGRISIRLAGAASEGSGEWVTF